MGGGAVPGVAVLQAGGGRVGGLWRTRRQLLGWTGRAAGAAAFLGAGVRPAGVALAAPSVSNPVIQLYYSAGGYESTRSTASLSAIKELIDTYFVPSHPGIAVKVNFNFHGNTEGLMAALLGGQGPDVFEEWYDLPVLIQQGMLLNIMPYVRQSNLNLNEFMPGEISEVSARDPVTGTVGVYGLPAYMHQFAMIVNLGLLDELGLPYPSEEWDYTEAEQLWRQVAGTVKGQRRYGGAFRFQTEGPDSCYLHGWGGSYVDPANPLRCTLDQPAAIAAGNWLFGLLNEQVATNQFGQGHFQNGLLLSFFGGTDGEMPGIASGLRNMKFRFYPFPRWPNGWYTEHAEDFHAIFSGTKYPEQAWEFLQFLSTDHNWQRGLIQLYLAGPALPALWPDYVRIVEQFAPPLRGKNLEVFIWQAQHNMPIFRAHFAYATDQAYQMIGSWTSQITTKHLSVADAFTQAAKQVNAFEAAQAEAAAHAQGQNAALQHLLAEAKSDPEAVTFPAPRYIGPSGGPTKATDLVTVRQGTYTVVGVGSGLQGGSDGGTFACQAWVHAAGVFSCRLTAMANVNSPTYLASGAGAGLMARADLGPSAPEVALVVQSNRGVHFHGRPLEGLNVKDQRPRNYPGTGLLNPTGLLHNGHHPHKNYLLQPIWLRLQQRGNVWTAFTSLDGQHWQQAGLPFGIEAGGVWIGLFVTPHDSKTGDKPYKMSAAFDHVTGFTPATFVTIGSP